MNSKSVFFASFSLFVLSTVSSHSQTHSELLGRAFLNRPYTLMDHAIDALDREASQWAAGHIGSKYSKDFVEPAYGMIIDGNAFRSEKGDSMIVALSLAPNRIVGIPSEICRKHLQQLSKLLLGTGRDVVGRDMHIKTMAMRLGPSVSTDTTAAYAAAEYLVQRTKVVLTIDELEKSKYVSCTFVLATGAIYAGVK